MAPAPAWHAAPVSWWTVAAVLAAYAAVCGLQLWHFRRALRRAFEPLGRRLDQLAANVRRLPDA